MLPIEAHQAGGGDCARRAFGLRPLFSPPTTDHAEIAPVYGEFVEALCFSVETLAELGTKLAADARVRSCERSAHGVTSCPRARF
jgi:hypothetical protein